ncbi:MAG: hypothetical protein L3J79_12990 [Candidatus Marinimicrobia bacterium]|nr:hypothetical protein [Candidatus Neomarinimicrobiota bacterium]
MVPTCCLLVFAWATSASADILQIKPYAQWTFEMPVEQVFYRQSGTGFPIKLIVTSDQIILYDSTGNQVREISRAQNDLFVMNENHFGFMLVQEHPSNQIDLQQRLYSFQVYSHTGEADYTTVQAVDLIDGELSYQLTDQSSILLTEKGQAWVWEVQGEDTLFNITSCSSGTAKPGTAIALARVLNYRREMVTAVACLESGGGDSSSIELRLWHRDQVLLDPLLISGGLAGLRSLANSDYFFLEIDRGAETSLTLFNRLDSLATYPWKSWKIELLDQQAVFVITEQDLNVVNLGDGSIAASYHPIDLSTISDATYLQEWGLFLYIRYEPFFRKDGRQAFRNFELEGVSRSGRIVHRSSFGTWTYSLPKLTQIGSDLFAVHIYNAVLIYRIQLQRD